MGLGCGVVDRCTCNMPAATLRVPSRTTFIFLSTVMYMSVNVAVQPLQYSLPVEISDLNWSWRKMCYVLALMDNKGLRLSSDLWVTFTGLPSGRITCFP